MITVVPRPWNIITAYAVVGGSGLFDRVEGDLCALFGDGSGCRRAADIQADACDKGAEECSLAGAWGHD